MCISVHWYSCFGANLAGCYVFICIYLSACLSVSVFGRINVFIYLSVCACLCLSMYVCVGVWSNSDAASPASPVSPGWSWWVRVWWGTSGSCYLLWDGRVATDWWRWWQRMERDCQVAYAELTHATIVHYDTTVLPGHIARLARPSVSYGLRTRRKRRRKKTNTIARTFPLAIVTGLPLFTWNKTMFNWTRSLSNASL